MKTFHKLSPIHHAFGAVFRVETESRGNVYMCVARSNCRSDERAIVEVDAARFLALWRNRRSSHNEIAMGSPATWINDYKFHWAEDGFTKGETNPVPLADVGCGTAIKANPIWRRRFPVFQTLDRVDQVKEHYVGFTNGITRTIWLLTYGAKAFPVECDSAEAPLLHSLAGTTDSKPLTVDELIPMDEVRKFYGTAA